MKKTKESKKRKDKVKPTHGFVFQLQPTLLIPHNPTNKNNINKINIIIIILILLYNILKLINSLIISKTLVVFYSSISQNKLPNTHICIKGPRL